MKHRMTGTACILTLILLLLIPAFAMGDTPLPAAASLPLSGEDDHAHTCADDACAAASANKENSLVQVYTEAQLRWMKTKTCTHQTLTYFHDTDTNETRSFCTFCGYSTVLSDASALSVQPSVTSAAIRAICQHVLGQYFATNNDSLHYQVCSLCSSTIYSYHTIVPEDCVTDKHCSDCGYAPDHWPKRLGHDPGYYCLNFGVDTTHQRRCMRGLESDYSCEEVFAVQPCSFFLMHEPTSTDPATGLAIHDRWNYCTLCGNFEELDDMECSAPLYCFGCTQVDHFPPR